MSKEQTNKLPPIIRCGLIITTILLISFFEIISITNLEITSIIYLTGLSWYGVQLYKLLKIGVNKIYARFNKQNSN